LIICQQKDARLDEKIEKIRENF